MGKKDRNFDIFFSIGRANILLVAFENSRWKPCLSFLVLSKFHFQEKRVFCSSVTTTRSRSSNILEFRFRNSANVETLPGTCFIKVSWRSQSGYVTALPREEIEEL